MSAAPAELRAALRAFRAGLAGAYLEEPAVLEASYRTGEVRVGTVVRLRNAHPMTPDGEILPVPRRGP